MQEFQHFLFDWQSETHASNTPLTLDIIPRRERIDIGIVGEEPNRTVWIENENGTLRIHCYGTNDEPMTVELPRGKAARIVEQ